MDTVTLTVNGQQYPITAPPDQPLLWVLRENLHLSGTKYGCGEGQCGACTVLLEGRPVRSCLTSLSSAAGKKIITIEGLASREALHPVQEAFLQEESFQCGYCTSGMILSAVALLSNKPQPSEEEIIHGMTGNICRCGTYPRIIKAVHRAALSKRNG